jgi:multidrug efflux system membrane fusion protein
VQAALARDLAMLENAEGEYDRYSKLLKSQVVTTEQVDQMRANAGSARATVLADSANLATAKFNLDNTTIRAPLSGRTGALLVRPGNLARAAGGTPMVVINQVRPILVRFSVPGSQLPMILHYGGKGGLPVRASPGTSGTPQAPAPTTTPLDASATNAAARQIAVPVDTTDPPAEGTLFFIDNAVDTTTGTVQLKAKFDNRSGTLWAGQFVAASLRLFVEEGALVVPAQCVVTGQKGTYVYVIDSANTAEQRPVTVERSSNGLTVIAAGLNEGERVVTEGMSRLAQGAPVDLGTGGDSTGRGGRGGRGGGGKAGGRGGGKAGGRGGGKAGGQGKTP